MKRVIRSAVAPWKTRYTVHWMSPDGKDCLLAGNNDLDAAVESGIKQAKELMENPWETDERKLLFLENMYIADGDRVIDTELDDITEGMMSELDSRIKMKKRPIQSSKTLRSQCSFDFLHDGYYSTYEMEIVCTVACEQAGVEFVAMDCYEVDYSMYPEYADRNDDITQCSFDFDWAADDPIVNSIEVERTIESVIKKKLNDIDYELLGISFTSLD